MTSATLTSPFLPIATLDPRAPLDDLEPLVASIGDARVVAIGESVHYGHEFYLLRHRLSRFLVERLGFDAVVLESGFPEGFLVDAWIHGGPGEIHDISTRGITYGFGQCEEMRAHLEWMRGHNASGGHPVQFYGLDVPASMGSLLPPLDAIIPFMTEVDPVVVPNVERIRELVRRFEPDDPTAFADDYTVAGLSAYADLPVSERNALTAGLADLAARFNAMRLTYLQCCKEPAYDLARQQVRCAVQTDAAIRQFTALGAGDAASRDVNVRDWSMAETVEWILGREGRVVLLAHNAHIQRTPLAPGMLGLHPTSMMGHHLADRLGADYLPIGTTFASGETFYYDLQPLDTLAHSTALRWAIYDLPPAGTETVDGLLAASHPELAILDLRTVTPEDQILLDTTRRMRFLQTELDVGPIRTSFDLLVHVPRITVWHSPVIRSNAD